MMWRIKTMGRTPPPVIARPQAEVIASQVSFCDQVGAKLQGRNRNDQYGEIASGARKGVEIAMTVTKRAVVIALVFMSLPFAAFAASVPPSQLNVNSEDMRLLREASTAYRANDFGKALEYAERAKHERRRIIQLQYNMVNNSFKAGEVKRAHGVLTDIIPILRERDEYDVIDIIVSYQRRLPESYLKDSADNLTAFLAKNDAFPEADLLIGRVYRLEGEYSLSRQYLLAAWQNASLLDITDEQYMILYELAELCALEDDMDGYEKNLLLILKDTEGFNDEGLKGALLSRIRGGRQDDMEKFFLLFRCEDSQSIRAYSLLADYYSEVGEKNKSLVTSALGVLTGFTKIFDTVKARDPEFEYKGVQSLFDKMTEYPDMMDWAEEQRLWHAFNEFAVRVSAEGGKYFAPGLLTILSESTPEEYWRQQAAQFLADVSNK